MLGEQGWPGLILWLTLHVLGLVQMERIRRRWIDSADERLHWYASFANALQQAQIVYLVGAAFVGIAFQPFMFLIVGLQCGLWGQCRDELRKPAARQISRRPMRAVEVLPPSSP